MTKQIEDKIRHYCEPYNFRDELFERVVILFESEKGKSEDIPALVHREAKRIAAELNRVDSVVEPEEVEEQEETEEPEEEIEKADVNLVRRGRRGRRRRVEPVVEPEEDKE